MSAASGTTARFSFLREGFQRSLLMLALTHLRDWEIETRTSNVGDVVLLFAEWRILVTLPVNSCP